MRNKIIGGVVGGCLGFIIGAIVADRLFPEFYEEWEDVPRINEYLVNYGPSAVQEIETKKLVGKPLHGNKKGKIVDYVKYGGFEKKPSLDTLVKEKEEDLVEEGKKFEFDEDDPVLFSDYTDLSVVSYEEYLAVRDETLPFFLSAAEFEDMEADEPNMPITKLTYYTHDDVLVRSVDNRPIVIDPVKLIGEAALYPHNSGIFGNPTDVVYIYNPILDGVYRIVTVHKSFEDVVAGVVRKPERIKPDHKEEEDE